jgi:hypothetical protein
MLEDDNFDDAVLDGESADERYWTLRRVLWLVIALLIIAALIASMLWPLLFDLANPPPPSPTSPFGRI